MLTITSELMPVDGMCEQLAAADVMDWLTHSQSMCAADNMHLLRMLAQADTGIARPTAL
jgi:hypothetical protein